MIQTWRGACERGDKARERVDALGAFAGERLHRIGAAIVDDELVAAAHEAARHVRAHPAEADHSELHYALLLR